MTISIFAAKPSITTNFSTGGGERENLEITGGSEDVNQGVAAQFFRRARYCLKIEEGNSARLLTMACVGSEFTARGVEEQALPPRPPPKSTAASPLSIFRPAPNFES